MRNLFIISSDKPSRLHNYTFDGLALSKKTLNWKEARHVYITNDEEIKDGDWVIDNDYDKSLVYKADRLFFEIGKEAKKIILTTDQDLIKDGVQAIDDEFLEWFIKNPSCERVEVEEYYSFEIGDWTYKIIVPRTTQQIIDEDYSSGLTLGQIIPKEEPTFENSIDNTMNIMSIANSMFGKKEEPKQETLEEAAERISKSHSVHETGQDDVYQGVIQGAKWQQEQCEKDLDAHLDVAKTLWLQAVKENKKMYSEEESIQKIIDYVDFQFNTKRELNLEIKKWFEQFKKK